MIYYLYCGVNINGSDKNIMDIYFCGSIRGGREKVNDYVKIVNLLKKYGTVLTEHIANKTIDNEGEKGITKKEIYERDIDFLEKADIVIAETTVPSLGVGYELAYAEKLGKKIICLFDTKENQKGLSAMIEGNTYNEIINYENVDEMLIELEKKLNK